jgi:hypothetical protein
LAEVAAELADVLETACIRGAPHRPRIPAAENFSLITTEPPLSSNEPIATRPPAVWYIGRQSYMRSVGLVSITPAKALSRASRGSG